MRLLAAALCAMNLTVGAAMLAACASAPLPEGAAGEDETATSLSIDAGRIEVLNDRIVGALDLLAPGAAGEAGAAPDLAAAARSVRRAALNYLAIKERACAEGRFVPISCARLATPTWLAEPPTQTVSAAVLRKRIDEVQALMDPLLKAACDAGKKKSGDELFCSVE